jgi:ABC-type transport system involved in cytochrome c biogenesis permease component
MTFLPIVDRELRVAARRRTTYLTRVVAAALVILIFGGLQLTQAFRPGMFFTAGQTQFFVLKWLGFLFACSAGVFLTSDSLSEEKREGTLGLLFLTDLRGYDVVLGKFISHSVQAFYGLLAALPVLALTLLAGGVSGGEFWRMMLVFCNTLFFSLSIGLLVSSISRDAMKAINGTLLICLLFIAGLPLVDWAAASWDPLKFDSRLSLASPGYLFLTVGPIATTTYWHQLSLQHFVAWTFLAASSICTPRAWQDKTPNASGNSLGRFWRYGTSRGRSSLRRKLLARDPVHWLAMRDRWLPRLVWAVAWLALGLLGWGILYSGGFRVPLTVGYYSQTLLALALYLWMASQASRFYVDAVRTGAMELILVAPVSPGQIVRSQWMALRRTFLFPAMLVVGLKTLGGLAMILEMQKAMAGTASGGPGFNFIHSQIVTVAAGAVNFVGDLLAIAWFGMWMGLTSKKTTTAVVKTFAFVIVLPWLALMFLQGFLMALFTLTLVPRGVLGGWSWSLLPAVIAAANLGKDLFFICWSRRNLLTRFRDTVSRDGPLLMPRTPPQLPSTLKAPPLPRATKP